MNQLESYTDAQLFAEMAECMSFKGEIETRMEPVKAEILRRQIATGETVVEHGGWQSTLAKEPISAAWIERQYGYPKKELPPEVFEEVVKPELSAERVIAWLSELGHEVNPTYTMRFGRKRAK